MEDRLWQRRNADPFALEQLVPTPGMSCVYADGPGSDSDACNTRTLTVDVGTFALQALEEQSALQGVSVEELASFSVLYYLADSDSGRISRRLPQSATRRQPSDQCKAGDSEAGVSRTPNRHGA
jgi:hypothetical protein